MLQISHHVRNNDLLQAEAQSFMSDAWQLFDDFTAILRRLYGPPVFRPFEMKS